jgi:DHA1 family bicyclomycin/chloramphenicol resistance-like MFS transporter
MTLSPGLFTWLLAGLAGLSAMGVDMCLPALPLMATHYHVAEGKITWLVSLYLCSHAITSLVMGPLSDTLGRRRLLLAGLTLFTLSSIMCANCNTWSALLFWRILQGSGASLGSALGRAIVRDSFSGEEAQHILAKVTTVFGLAPMIAPALGSLILKISHFAAIFWLLAALGLVFWIWVYIALPETKPAQEHVQSSTPLLSALSGYYHCLAHPEIRYYCALICIAFAMQFSYIVCSPYIFIEILQCNTTTYAYLFASTALAYMLGAQGSARRSTGVLSPIFNHAEWSIMGAGLLMICNTWLHYTSIWAWLLPAWIWFMALGVLNPRWVARCLEPVPQWAGTASALMGFLQLVSGSLVSIWVAQNTVAYLDFFGYFIAASALLLFLLMRWPTPVFST